MRRKVLVTGAYGFLGKYVIDELVDHHYRVVAFGRKREELEKLRDKQVEIFQGDFCNYDDALAAAQKADYIIHCGALSTVWGRRDDFIRTNVDGTVNLMKAARQAGIKRMVYVSSPSIYAARRDRLNIDESDYDPKNRLNYYIESKILAEQKIREFDDVDYVIIRPRGLFGVGDTSIIPRLIRANQKIGIPIFNGGRNIVDMTCVENVALALRLALESNAASRKTYNITNGEPHEFRELLEELFQKLRQKPRYLDANVDFMYNVAGLVEVVYKLARIYREPLLTKYNVCTLGYSQTLDIENAVRDLGYHPKISLREGIEKYAKAYRENSAL